jgi:thiamine-phosphate diphosphorylase
MLDISLYAIIDDDLLFTHSHTSLAIALQKAGVSLIQYRAKNTPIQTMIKHAKAMREVLTIPFLINDRVDVALAANLGQSDMSPLDARRLLGDKAIIGLTLKTLHDIENAPIDALNYGACGAVYNTTSKDNATPIGIHGLESRIKAWRSRTNLPLCAIAGINAMNIKTVMETGIDGVAIISALSKSNDPFKEAINLRRLMK